MGETLLEPIPAAKPRYAPPSSRCLVNDAPAVIFTRGGVGHPEAMEGGPSLPGRRPGNAILEAQDTTWALRITVWNAKAHAW